MGGAPHVTPMIQKSYWNSVLYLEIVETTLNIWEIQIESIEESVRGPGEISLSGFFPAPLLGEAVDKPIIARGNRFR